MNMLYFLKDLGDIFGVVKT